MATNISTSQALSFVCCYNENASVEVCSDYPLCGCNAAVVSLGTTSTHYATLELRYGPTDLFWDACVQSSCHRLRPAQMVLGLCDPPRETTTTLPARIFGIVDPSTPSMAAHERRGASLRPTLKVNLSNQRVAGAQGGASCQFPIFSKHFNENMDDKDMRSTQLATCSCSETVASPSMLPPS